MIGHIDAVDNQGVKLFLFQLTFAGQFEPESGGQLHRNFHVVQKMQEFGFPVKDIERVFNCGRTSQNAYINKQYHNKLRLINLLQRRNQYVDSSIYNDLINLARNWNPEEITEKAPIEEIIQIFA